MTSHRQRPTFERLEAELRRRAAVPDFDFAVALEAVLWPPAPPRPGRPARRVAPRAVAALGLSATLAAGIAATGSLGYAAGSVDGFSRLVRRAALPHANRTPLVVRGLSAGSDQYRPGFGFGDPNHNHTGPPGIERVTDSGAGPGPLAARPAGKLGKVVKATVTFDEQAHLYLSVIDPKGKPLLLTQRSKRGGSRVGGSPLRGPQTKFIQFAVLVPRTIPIALRVPSNLLRNGVVYRIRIVAIDPDGNKSRIFIRFRP